MDIENRINVENRKSLSTTTGLTGQMRCMPIVITDLMLQYQEAQGNGRDLEVFSTNKSAKKIDRGFDWEDTVEGYDFWRAVIERESFDVFYNFYPIPDLRKLLQEERVGSILYSSLHGDVKFRTVVEGSISCVTDCGHEVSFNQFGRLCDYPNGECVLFPSDGMRDWYKYIPLDIPVGEPCLIRTDPNWELVRYAGYNEYFCRAYTWNIGDLTIIPVKDFDFTDFELNKKRCLKTFSLSLARR